MASAFDYYLRTGRRIALEAPCCTLETKFNPWHDPENGRFTFAGQGRHFPGGPLGQTRPQRSAMFGGGSGGGGEASGSAHATLRAPKQPFHGRGGSFGGGGASGNWIEMPPQNPSPRPAGRMLEGAIRSPGRTPRPPPEPRLTVRNNGYEFSIDAHARTRLVTGGIRVQSQPRSRSAQANAGKPDRRTTDDGGHYIAARFNGPREWFNHFAQDANFNRGAYRALEDEWAKAVRSGKRVFVDIVPHYRGTSMRPYLLTVRWTIEGATFKRDLPNEKQGK
jgi:hypothetical protein